MKRLEGGACAGVGLSVRDLVEDRRAAEQTTSGLDITCITAAVELDRAGKPERIDIAGLRRGPGRDGEAYSDLLDTSLELLAPLCQE